LSKVISPIRLESVVQAGDDGLVYLELFGEDGRIITSQKLSYPKGKRYLVVERVPFEIPGVAETARLSLRVMDRFYRRVAISSVNLILLSVGREEINPAESLQSPYIVREPDPDETITGGLLNVEGLARPVNDKPIVIELIAENGQVVGSTQVRLPPPTGDLSHTPFQVSIPYQVDSETSVRLTFSQESSDRIPGTAALMSFNIVLKP
jgi:hypothetical protein